MKNIKAILIAFSLLGLGSPALANDCNVRMLVVYTESAATGIGGYSLMMATVKSAVDNINQSYTNSGINHKIVLAGIVRLTYTEPGCYFTTLGQLESTNDGYMDEVHTLRTQYRADVVALILNDNSRCGLADNVLGASHAFLVVNYRCVGTNYSLARELGYLYQCGNHETQLTSEGAFFNNGGYANAYGYIYDDYNTPANSFSTIMAWTDDEGRSDTYADFNMIPYWSNPNKNYNGVPTGDASHNNANVINTTVATLKGYQVNSSGSTLGSRTIRSYESGFGIAVDSLTLKSVVVQDKCEMKGYSAGSVRLAPGFQSLYGSISVITIDATIKTCTVSAPGSSARVASVSDAPAAVETVVEEEPNSLRFSCHPNPFTQNVTITYHLKDASDVTAGVYTTSGELRTVLVDSEAQIKGQHSIVFDSHALSAGVYVIKLRINGNVSVNKIVKIN